MAEGGQGSTASPTSLVHSVHPEEPIQYPSPGGRNVWEIGPKSLCHQTECASSTMSPRCQFNTGFCVLDWTEIGFIGVGLPRDHHFRNKGSSLLISHASIETRPGPVRIVRSIQHTRRLSCRTPRELPFETLCGFCRPVAQSLWHVLIERRICITK